MHEIGIMEDTLLIAEHKAIAAGATKIYSLKIRVGAISGVEPDALCFAFDVLSEKTLAAGAKLEIESVPVICFCEGCLKEFSPDGILYECPDCQQFSTQIRQGKELELMALEIDSE